MSCTVLNPQICRHVRERQLNQSAVRSEPEICTTEVVKRDIMASPPKIGLEARLQDLWTLHTISSNVIESHDNLAVAPSILMVVTWIMRRWRAKHVPQPLYTPLQDRIGP